MDWVGPWLGLGCRIKVAAGAIDIIELHHNKYSRCRLDIYKIGRGDRVEDSKIC
jgi:hypothetical protein